MSQCLQPTPEVAGSESHPTARPGTRRGASLALLLLVTAASLGCQPASNAVPGREASLAHLTAPPASPDPGARARGTAREVARLVFREACAPRRAPREVARAVPSPARKSSHETASEPVETAVAAGAAHGKPADVHGQPADVHGQPADVHGKPAEVTRPVAGFVLPEAPVLRPGEGYVDGSSIRERVLHGSGGAPQAASPGRAAADLGTPARRLVGSWKWQCDGAVSEYCFGPADSGSGVGLLVVNDVGVARRGTYRMLKEDAAAGTVTVSSSLLGGVRVFPIAPDGQRLYERFPNQCVIEYAYAGGGSPPASVAASRRAAPNHVAMERRSRTDRGL